MGCDEGVLPLKPPAGSEITTDTLLLSNTASLFSPNVCIDLGTGSGEILKNSSFLKTFSIGLDISFDALRSFDKSFGQPVLCSVQSVSQTFRADCADLVLANPPYFDIDSARKSPVFSRGLARTGDSMLLYRFIFAAAHLLKIGGNFLISGRTADADKIEQGLRAARFKHLKRIEDGKIIIIHSTLVS